jgi:uncharacterized protein YegL
VALLSYWGTQEIEIDLGSDRRRLLAAIQGMSRAWPGNCSGNTELVWCLSVPNLRDALERSQRLFDPASPRRRAIILYQPDYCNRDFEYYDGECRGYSPAEGQAKAIRDAGTQIVVFDGGRVGYRQSRMNGTPYQGDARPLGSSDADTVLTHREAQHRMVRYHVPDYLATNFQLVDRLPENMHLVTGSVSPPGTAGGDVVTWDMGNLDVEPAPFTLAVAPQQIGRWPTNIEALATFVDGWGTPGRIVFPIPEVDVFAPTPTVVPTTEPTPTSVPTRLVRRNFFLPIAFQGHCLPTPGYVDAVLAVDTSSSMSGAKLDAAKAALVTFVDVLDLGPGRDQAAIVSFAADADIAQHLTADRSAVLDAVVRLSTSEGTRIDLGVEAAVEELSGAYRQPDNRPVIVLLSDGRQADPQRAVAAGNRARELGIEVFAIGLGADVDSITLAAIATDAGHYAAAPSESDLEGIYRRIASTVPCR